MQYLARLLVLAVAWETLLATGLKLRRGTPGSVVEADDGCLYRLVSLLPANSTASFLSQMTLLGEETVEQPQLLRDQADVYQALKVDLKGRPCQPSATARLLPPGASQATLNLSTSQGGLESNHSSLLRFKKKQAELADLGSELAGVARDSSAKAAFRRILARVEVAGAASNGTVVSFNGSDTNKSSVMTGSMQIHTIEPATFVNDTACINALRMTIAKLMNISVDYVQVNYTVNKASNQSFSLLQLLPSDEEVETPAALKNAVTAHIKITVPASENVDLRARRDKVTAESFHKEVSKRFRQASLSGMIHAPHEPDVVSIKFGDYTDHNRAFVEKPGLEVESPSAAPAPSAVEAPAAAPAAPADTLALPPLPAPEVSKPVIQPAIQPVIQPVIQPILKPVMQPVVQPLAQQAYPVPGPASASFSPAAAVQQVSNSGVTQQVIINMPKPAVAVVPAKTEHPDLKALGAKVDDLAEQLHKALSQNRLPSQPQTMIAPVLGKAPAPAPDLSKETVESSLLPAPAPALLAYPSVASSMTAPAQDMLLAPAPSIARAPASVMMAAPPSSSVSEEAAEDSSFGPAPSVRTLSEQEDVGAGTPAVGNKKIKRLLRDAEKNPAELPSKLPAALPNFTGALSPTGARESEDSEAPQVIPTQVPPVLVSPTAPPDWVAHAPAAAEVAQAVAASPVEGGDAPQPTIRAVAAPAQATAAEAGEQTVTSRRVFDDVVVNNNGPTDSKIVQPLVYQVPPLAIGGAPSGAVGPDILRETARGAAAGASSGYRHRTVYDLDGKALKAAIVEGLDKVHQAIIKQPAPVVNIEGPKINIVNNIPAYAGAQPLAVQTQTTAAPQPIVGPVLTPPRIPMPSMVGPSSMVGAGNVSPAAMVSARRRMIPSRNPTVIVQEKVFDETLEQLQVMDNEVNIASKKRGRVLAGLQENMDRSLEGAKDNYAAAERKIENVARDTVNQTIRATNDEAVHELEDLGKVADHLKEEARDFRRNLSRIISMDRRAAADVRNRILTLPGPAMMREAVGEASTAAALLATVSANADRAEQRQRHALATAERAMQEVNHASQSTQTAQQLMGQFMSKVFQNWARLKRLEAQVPRAAPAAATAAAAPAAAVAPPPAAVVAPPPAMAEAPEISVSPPVGVANPEAVAAAAPAAPVAPSPTAM